MSPSIFQNIGELDQKVQVGIDEVLEERGRLVVVDYFDGDSRYESNVLVDDDDMRFEDWAFRLSEVLIKEGREYTMAIITRKVKGEADQSLVVHKVRS